MWGTTVWRAPTDMNDTKRFAPPPPAHRHKCLNAPEEVLEPAADVLEAGVGAEEELLADVTEALQRLAEVRGRQHVFARILQHGAVHLALWGGGAGP